MATKKAAEAATEGTTLKVHHLRPAPGAKKSKHRVGRGDAGKGGKTAGRGTKGTKARNKVRVGFEGGQMPLHMRLPRSEEHTSELQSRGHLVCRLLLENKNAV